MKTRSLTFFDWQNIIKPNKQERLLRIVQINNVGSSLRELKQNEIKLDEEQRKSFYEMLKKEFEKENA